MTKGPAGGYSLVLYLRLILGPMVFNIFNNDWTLGQSLLLASVQMMQNLGGLAAKSGGCSAVQRDLNRETGEFGRWEPHGVLQQEVLGSWG